MEEHHKFSKITVLLITVLVIAGGVGAWYFWKNYDDKNQEQFATDTVEWVDYENSKYNMTFQYPNNAEVKEFDDGQFYKVYVEGPDRSYFVYVNRISEDATLDQFVTESEEVVTAINTQDGLSTATTTASAEDAGIESEGDISYYWFEKDGKVFNVYTDSTGQINMEKFISNFKLN